MRGFHPVPEGVAGGVVRRSDLAHGLGVDEVIVAPDARVVVVLPLHVDVEVGEVVALWDCKLLPHLVTLLLTALKTHTNPVLQASLGSFHLHDTLFHAF